MPHTSSLDDVLFPPFEGFPREGMAFLKKLKKNNNRPWFQKHREVYEESVRFPMQCLVASLAERMADAAPEMEFNPRKSIFRIYRDVRFSKNKAPYKTNIAASFRMKGEGTSPVENPGLYLGIGPGEIYIGGGLYMPTADQLKAIRKSIAGQPDEFLAVAGGRSFKRDFGGIQGETLSKAPLGYPRDHPMIEYLKHKQFYIGKDFDDESICLKPRFLDQAVRVLTGTMPFLRWLAAAAR